MRRKLGTPATYGDAFRSLGEDGVLEERLAEALVRAVGFRNAIVHAYDNLDMSLVYGTLTDVAIARALEVDDSPAQDFTGRIILPGLAAGLAAPVSQIVGRPVEVGPICAAELPLYFLGQKGVSQKDGGQ